MAQYEDGDWLEFPKGHGLKLRKVRREVLAEEKLDGERLALWRGHAYGRRESSVTLRRENRWDSLPDAIKALATPTPVEGEIFVEGGTSSDVKTAINEAREGQDTGLARGLRFVAFRVATPSALMEPAWHRRELLAMEFDVPRAYAAGIGAVNPPGTAPQYVQLDELMVERLKEEARKNSMEGWMLKERTSEYRWWKLKLEETADLVVTGFKDGKGKYEGFVGAVLGSMYEPDGTLTEVAAVSGMTDEEREAIDEQKDMGRVMEVKFQCWAAQGRMRHPRFVRWRDDKPANDCRREV